MSTGKNQSTIESTTSKASSNSHEPPLTIQHNNNNGKVSRNNVKAVIGSSMTSNGGNPDHILDRFGFILNIDSQGNVIDQSEDGTIRYRFFDRQPTPEEMKRTEGRKKKWNTMITKWSPLFWPTLRQQQEKQLEEDEQHQQIYTKLKGRKYSILLRRARKGIPDSERNAVWPVLCNVALKIKENPGLYDRLVQQSVVRLTLTPKAVSDSVNENGTGTTVDSTSTTGTNTRANLAVDNDNQLNGLATPASAPDPTTSNEIIQQIFNHTKSFRTIQDTIERDIHRTFPRHSMFCEDNCPMESDEECYTTNVDTTSSIATSDQDENDVGCNGYSGKQESNSNNKPQPATFNQVDAAKEFTNHGDDSNSSSQSLRLPRVRSLEITSSIHELTTNNDREPKVELIAESNTVTGTNAAKSSSNPVTPKSTGTSSTPTSCYQQRGENSDVVTPELVLQGRGGQAAMRRVLKAYSTYDKEVGYCQGMNFITGMFLTFMSEEEAFWMLVAVMFERPCKMRGLFGEGMKETHKVLYVADKLINQFLPKLAKHLETESVHVTMFATQWLLTVYTSSFKFDLVTRVWDCFLIEGWKATYRVMLSLLQHHQSTLLSLSFEEILAFIREISEKSDGAVIVDDSMKIPLRWSHILKYENEWNSQQR